MLIGDSSPEYVLTRTAIIALRSIAPLSIAYCVSVPVINLDAFKSLPWLPISVWAGAETAFFAVSLVVCANIHQEACHPRPPDQTRRTVLFQRCLDSIRDYKAFLQGWFLGSSIERIGRTDCIEFYAWSMLNKKLSQITDSEYIELEDYISDLERRVGRTLPPGRRGARSLRGTLDAVPLQHRPLLWYLIIGVVDVQTSLRLYFHGFKFHPQSLATAISQFPIRPLALFGQRTSPGARLSYWYRHHGSKTKPPILFIHGIGVGLYTYTGFLRQLAKNTNMGGDEDVGVIAIEILPISARICQAALTASEMRAEILEILEAHGWDEFTLVGHSYGTGISANILGDREICSQIRSVVLIDPICFLLHLPDVAYNFTRRKPRKASEHMLHYFSSQDIGISHTIARRFFWSEFILWKEDVAADLPLTVILSAKDIIVPVDDVWRYLTGTEPPSQRDAEDNTSTWQQGNRKVEWFHHLNHAGIFASANDQQAAACAVLEKTQADK